MKHGVLFFAASVALSGCALKGDVRRVESELRAFREETARADSVRAVMLAQRLDEIVMLHGRALDSLEVLQRGLMSFQGDLRGDLTEVQRQLVAIQELTGQSETRLRELRGRIDQRVVAPGAAAPAGPVAERAPPAGGQPPAMGPEDLYEIGIQQHRRGSPRSARMAFQKLIDDFPRHDRAADAQYFIGETFGAEQPDSAEAAYEQVVESYPNSPRAPAALYKIALLYEQRGEIQAARLHYRRIVVGYPRSEEAELARRKLGNS